jgi:hypothetical protein
MATATAGTTATIAMIEALKRFCMDPSYDLIKALQAIGPHQDRPVVLIGERGVGKSHLMAALHHAGTDPIERRLGSPIGL